MTAALYLAEPDQVAAAAVGDPFTLAGDEGRHAVAVKRTRVGETVLVADGLGRVLQLQVASVDAKSLTGQVLAVDGLNRIPDGVGFDEASAAEPFACAINAQEQLGIEAGDTVVVFGAGPIGCIHVRIARGVHKAGMVVLVDVNAERLKMSADAVHPEHVIDASTVDVVDEVRRLTGGRGADVVITATAANVTQEQAIAMAARNGRISFFGGLPKTNPTITCDSNLVHYRQLHIHGANGSAPEHNKRALSYIASGLVPVKDLITVHLPLERALEAFDIVAKGEAIKVTVEP